MKYIISSNTENPLYLSMVEKGNFKKPEYIIGKFANGETRISIHDDLMGQDVVLFACPCSNPNDEIMQILILADACHRMRVGSLTLVMPYCFYARQDRTSEYGEPISARMFGQMVDKSTIQRVLTVHLHSDQVQGFFSTPVSNISTLKLFTEYFKGRVDENYVISSTDSGGAKLAKQFADMLGIDFVIVHKHRSEVNQAEVVGMIGDVKDKSVIIFDDMVDTGGSIVSAYNTLKEYGAKDVSVATTHGIFSPPAAERLSSLALREVVVTNTISNEVTGSLNATVLDVAPLILKMMQ